MRVWADVYDEDGVKLGTLTAIKSASVSTQLDGAGSYSLDLAIDERTIAALVNDLEVRVYVEQTDDELPQEWVRGLIRDVTITEAESGNTVTVSGPDTLDTLTETTVGIGRSYDAESIQTITNSLLSLTSGWTAEIETAVAADLQTTRFDGANVLRCLLRLVEEKGVHLRNGNEPNTVEIGAFGTPALSPTGMAVRAIKPVSTVSYELQANDAVLLIDRITQTQKSGDVVNWCIPVGAGEGSAALTLKDTTYAIYNENGTVYRAGVSSRYPIYRRVNGNGFTEYYIDASDGGRRRQAVVSFKEIGTIANSTLAKQNAANALAIAAMAYLDRQRLPLASYKLSASNVQADIKPGNLLPVKHKGTIEIDDETRSAKPRLTYLDVDQDMWVMKVTKKIAGDNISHDFEVATVDRYLMDHSKILVTMMEMLQARNVSVQTVPMVFPFMAYDTMQEGTTFLSGYNQGKKARLDLRINDYITDVTKVELHFITLPLHITGRNLFASPNYWTVFDVVTSAQYPSGISVYVNGADVSSQVVDIDSGAPAPFNVGANVATDARVDITSFITGASGGLYQNHKIELHCEHRLGDISLGGPDPAQSGTNASKGYAFMVAYVFGSLRAVFDGG